MKFTFNVPADLSPTRVFVRLDRRHVFYIQVAKIFHIVGHVGVCPNAICRIRAADSDMTALNMK